MSVTGLAPEQAAALAPLLSRRSAARFSSEAPTDGELAAILRAAVTVPDHGGLRPWRLVVVVGDARAPFGDALAEAARALAPDLGDAIFERIRAKAFAAPSLIAVVARVDTASKVPAWEQVASAACAGYAITLAAHQLGLGAMWKSTRFRDGGQLRTVLDMTADDRFLGWVNLGRPAGHLDPAIRPEIDLAPIVRHLGASGVPLPHDPAP